MYVKLLDGPTNGITGQCIYDCLNADTAQFKACTEATLRAFESNPRV